MERSIIFMIIVAILLSILYLGLIFWLYDGLNKLKKRYSAFKTYKPMISIIISAKNEQNNLHALFNAMLSQSYPQELIELIIVNDRSTDKTASIINEYMEQYPFIKTINIDKTKEGWAPKKWALHLAIDKSSHNIILQTDADCIPHPQWIEEMVKPFEESSVGFISAPAPLTNRKSFMDDVFELDSMAQDAFSAGGMGQGVIYSCTGRNMGFLKQCFKDVNGYEGISHFISGDDDLLLQKITTKSNYKIEFVLSPNALVDSPPPESIDQFIHQRIRFASKSMSYYNIDTTQLFKLTLPFLYFANLFVLFSMFKFMQTSNIVHLLPWIVKTSADGLYMYSYYHYLHSKWSFSAYLMMGVIHPLYISVFGFLGVFTSFKWKEK